jgi:hypothetical protein
VQRERELLRGQRSAKEHLQARRARNSALLDRGGRLHRRGVDVRRKALRVERRLLRAPVRSEPVRRSAARLLAERNAVHSVGRRVHDDVGLLLGQPLQRASGIEPRHVQRAAAAGPWAGTLCRVRPAMLRIRRLLQRSPVRRRRLRRLGRPLTFHLRGPVVAHRPLVGVDVLANRGGGELHERLLRQLKKRLAEGPYRRVAMRGIFLEAA